MRWELQEDVIEPEFNTYRGNAEICEWEFSIDMPEQFLSQDAVDEAVNKHIEELMKEGSRLLRMQVYRDHTSATWTTYFRMKVWATASPIAWLTVALIVFLAIAAVVIVYVIYRGVKAVTPIFMEYGQEAFDAIKWAAIAFAVVGGGLIVLSVVKQLSGKGEEA